MSAMLSHPLFFFAIGEFIAVILSMIHHSVLGVWEAVNGLFGFRVESRCDTDNKVLALELDALIG